MARGGSSPLLRENGVRRDPRGRRGHFFGAAQTLERYESAFYAPILSDWRNYESWIEAGSLTATARAQRISKQILAEFVPPPLDPAIRDTLAGFVARRKREGGVRER